MITSTRTGDVAVTVAVRGEATLPKSARNFYDLEAEGRWNGPGGRSFGTRGVVRVFVDAGGAPRSASILKIRTECSG